MAGRFSAMARSLGASFKIWGKGGLVQPHIYMGKIGIKNLNELSLNQVATSRKIRANFQVQRNLCRAIEDNLHKCEGLIAHYDRDIAGGALIEQFQLVVDDLNRYRVYFMQFVGAFGGLVFKATNMLNSVKTKIKSGLDILKYFDEILDELGKWCDISADYMLNASKQVVAVFNQEWLSQLHSQAAVINGIQTQIQQRIQKLRGDISAAKTTAQAVTVMSAFIQDLRNWSRTINNCANLLSGLVLQPRLDPKKATFRASKEIFDIFDLICQNYALTADLIGGQVFYVGQASLLGLHVDYLKAKMSPSTRRILRQIEAVESAR